MSYNGDEFYGQTEQDVFGNNYLDDNAAGMGSGYNSDYSSLTGTTDAVTDIDNNGDDISFGANLGKLQVAASLSQLSDWAGDSLFGSICNNLSDSLSGANIDGMEVLQEKVNDIADFYNIDPVNVFYEPGEPGVQLNGMTPLNYDNWIGGDPQVLSQFSDVYGEDFVTSVIAHETGHQIFDRLGLEAEYPRIANEACADAIAGLYAGAKGLDIDGLCEFFKQYPGDGKTYPENRHEIIREFYEIGQNYEWSMFQDIVDDPRFDLKAVLSEVAQRYTDKNI